MNYNYQIKKIGLIKTTGLSECLTVSQDKNYLIIRNLWQKFNRLLHKINNRQKNNNWIKYGITYQISNKYYYQASIVALDIRNNFIMNKNNIPEGNYICFIHKGPMYDIKKTIYDIYKIIIPELNINIKQKENTDLIHYEKYDYRFNWNNKNSIIEIYIPLK